MANCRDTNPKHIRVRAGTLAQWNSVNPILCAEEITYDKTTHGFKIGDGSTRWIDLPYVNLGGGSGGSQNLISVLSIGNSAGGYKIELLANPTAPQDAATKYYVDNLFSSIPTAAFEIDSPTKRTAMELNSNWGGTDNYNVVMTNNIATVLTGQKVGDYYYGQDSATGAYYKYEIGKIDGTDSVVRLLMRY